MSAHLETLLAVEGMTCRRCVAHVDEALTVLEGVSAVEVRLDEGRVRVRHDPGLVPVDALLEAVREAGYEAAPAT